MSFFEILAGMVAIGLVAACIGFFKDKFPRGVALHTRDNRLQRRAHPEDTITELT